ncbi:MAG: DNA polymerase IV [Actinobacteria bacterium]|nr:DNA polymerase IV [Actinomycetota bacterium]
MNSFAEHFLHVDMDAFFVEVERLYDPSLRGQAVVVGGLGNRGVVSSASYEARAHGVRSAMPIVEARRRAPHARFVASSMGRYGEVSEQVFETLRGVTPTMERLSVDEAFLDISGLRRHFDTALDVAREIRARIRSEVGIPASVGLATRKFISKLASEDAKPDGIHLVRAGEELAYLHPMPLRKLWGVGQATFAALEALGATTIGHVAQIDVEILRARLGPSLGQHLWQLSRGIDERSVTPGGGAKSVSVESTFATDVVGVESLERELLRLSDRLAGRLRRAGVRGRTVEIKVRYATFETVSRSVTPPNAVRRTHEIWQHGKELLAKLDIGNQPIRLLGIGVAQVGDAAAAEQLTLDTPVVRAADDAAELVRERFGDTSIMPASILGSEDRDRS